MEIFVDMRLFKAQLFPGLFVKVGSWTAWFCTAPPGAGRTNGSNFGCSLIAQQPVRFSDSEPTSPTPTVSLFCARVYSPGFAPVHHTPSINAAASLPFPPRKYSRVSCAYRRRGFVEEVGRREAKVQRGAVKSQS